MGLCLYINAEYSSVNNPEIYLNFIKEWNTFVPISRIPVLELRTFWKKIVLHKLSNILFAWGWRVILNKLNKTGWDMFLCLSRPFMLSRGHLLCISTSIQKLVETLCFYTMFFHGLFKLFIQFFHQTFKIANAQIKVTQMEKRLKTAEKSVSTSFQVSAAPKSWSKYTTVIFPTSYKTHPNVTPSLIH